MQAGDCMAGDAGQRPTTQVLHLFVQVVQLGGEDLEGRMGALVKERTTPRARSVREEWKRGPTKGERRSSSRSWK